MDQDKRHLVFAVDDEPEILEVYQFSLRSEYDVETFSSAEAVFARIADTQKPAPDIIITDLSMPKFDGNKLIKEVRRLDCNVPVIMVSGYLEKESMIDGLDAGITYYLEKPVELSILNDEVAKLLKIESERKLRDGIRKSLAQLREIYIGFRLACEPYVPPNILEKILVETPNGEGESRALNFDLVLDTLEEELEEMLTRERGLAKGNSRIKEKAS